MIFAGFVQKTSDTLDRALTVVTVMLLGAMTIVTFAQIIFRVFFTALIWSEEVARYMLVWLTFLGAGCVHKRSGHIAAAILHGLVPTNARKFFQILTHLICMVVFGVIIYYGILYVQVTSAQLSAAMRIPMRYIYIAIPLSGAVMMLNSISHILQTCASQEVPTK